MYHLSTQYNQWLFTVEQLKELRTKANLEYVQKQVEKKEIKKYERINDDFNIGFDGLFDR
jgi:hypothetical protein